MPRFYLDITQRTGSNWDDFGHEFNSLEAAERGALSAAGELALDRLRKGLPADLLVEVMDEQRQLMLSVMISTKVDRAASDTPHVSRRRSNDTGAHRRAIGTAAGLGTAL